MLASQMPLAADITATVRRSIPRALTAGIIAFPRLHDQATSLDGHGDSVKPEAVRLLGREAQAVLIAQFFLDPVVDLVDGRLPRYFEKSATRLARHLLQNLLAVRPLRLSLRKSPAPAPAAEATAKRL